LGAISKLFLPPPQLSGCLIVGIYRDTRGVVMSDEDRVNHFPASPLVTVTKVISGELRRLPTGNVWHAAKEQDVFPQLFVTAPQDTPLSSWAPSDVTALSLGIYHDAWLSLGGDTDFLRAPEYLAAAFESFATEKDPETGWNALCEKLSPVWAKKRPSTWQGTVKIADWARSVMTRTALSGSGRSVRSLERRIKRLSGQTRGSLDFYSAFENLHQIRQENSESSLAEIASDAGYADQSHMGRVVKRATGFSTARLNHAIENEEAFWCYRLLGERF